MPNGTPSEDLDARVERAIAEQGWFIQAVFRDPKRDIPSFAYTIGLTERFHHPELLMIGFREEDSVPMIRNAAALVARGTRFADWDRSDAVIPGLTLGFRAVPPAVMNDWALRAAARYGDAGYSLLQIMYPDRNGRMPWDADVEEPYRKIQGVLLDAMARARS